MRIIAIKRAFIHRIEPRRLNLSFGRNMWKEGSWKRIKGGSARRSLRIDFSWQRKGEAEKPRLLIAVTFPEMNVVVTIIKALPVSSVVPLITMMFTFSYYVFSHGVTILIFIHLFDDYAVAWMAVVMAFMVP